VRTFPGSSVISRLGGAVAALWLCSTGPAWAGDGGGGDAATAQAALSTPGSGICSLLGMTSCPQLPTLTQGILEISALLNASPDLVRSPAGPLGGICTVAGNGGFPVCSRSNAISAVNPPVQSANGGSGDQGNQGSGQSPINFSGLSSLAFMGPTSGPGQAVPVTSGANSFFYAVASGAGEQPDKLDLIYDYPSLTNSTFTKGQLVAAISLPLQVLNADGSERSICGPQAQGSKMASCAVSLAMLQVSAVCTGGTNCLAASISGDFSTSGTVETRSLAELGVKFSVTFAPSPNSGKSHAIFLVQAPLIVIKGNDPAYFGVVPPGAAVGTPGSATGINQLSSLPTAFSTNELGFPFKGVHVGITPDAAPPVVGDGTVATFGFCASFLTNGTSAVHPAVAAFASIATDGTTYISSPIPSAVTGLTLQCPF
jgi:hypothetical protein